MSDPTPTTKPDQCALHVEGFPTEVRQQAKAKAALEGRTLRDWLVRVITTAVGRKRS